MESKSGVQAFPCLLAAFAFFLSHALGAHVWILAFNAKHRLLGIARLALFANDSAQQIFVCQRKLAHVYNTTSLKQKTKKQLFTNQYY